MELEQLRCEHSEGVSESSQLDEPYQFKSNQLNWFELSG